MIYLKQLSHMSYIPGISGTVSTVNSSAVTLGVAGVFTGTSENISQYGTVVISVSSNVDSAAGGVSVQFSPNGTDWTIFKVYSYYSGVTFQESIVIPCKNFRIIYTNGGVSQSTFRLQAIFHISKPATDSEQLIAFPGSQLDAFGRLKISGPATQLEVTHVRGLNPLQESTLVSGTGAVAIAANSPMVNLTVTPGPTGSSAIQSRQRGIYQPGKSILTYQSAVINAGSPGNGTGVVSRVGYYDVDNGIYFEHVGNGTTGTMSVVLRSSGTGAPISTSIAQSNWNIDKMDGTGTSGITLDFTKTLIFSLNFEWLGSGFIRYGFVVRGVSYTVHEIYNSNLNTIPYDNSGSQPLRCEITTTSGGGTLREICGTVISEGGFDIKGYAFAAYGTGLLAMTTTVRPVISLRLKNTGIFPKINVILEQVSVIVPGNTSRILTIYMFKDLATASVLTGSNFVSANVNSAIEYDVTSSAITLTNGTLLSVTLIAATSDQVTLSPDIKSSNNYILTSNISGLTDIVCICCQCVSGTDTVAGGLTWRELY